MNRLNTIIFKLMLAAFSLGSVLAPTATYAILSQDENSIVNDSRFYIRDDAETQNCATGSSSGSLGTTNDTSKAAGEARKKAIWDYLVAHEGYGVGPDKFKPYMAAGIMGNMQVESANTWNPTIVEGGSYSDNPQSGGYGIVQWTPGTKIIKPMAELKGKVNDLGSQLDLLWSQLFDPKSSLSEHAAGTDLLGTSEVAAATESFRAKFERNLSGPQPGRIVNAKAILAKFGSTVTTGGGVPVSASCQPTGAVPGNTAPGPKCGVPAPGSVAGATPPPSDYSHVHRDGWIINKRTLAMITAAEGYSKASGGPTTFKLSQGSYHHNPSGISGTTHDGGGAIDLEVGGMSSAERDIVVRSLRQAGFAAWNRHKPTFDEHIHAIAIGDTEMSDSAGWQVVNYFDGEDGLDGHAKDPDEKVGRPFPDWAGKFCKK